MNYRPSKLKPGWISHELWLMVNVFYRLESTYRHGHQGMHGFECRLSAAIHAYWNMDWCQGNWWQDANITIFMVCGVFTLCLKLAERVTPSGWDRIADRWYHARITCHRMNHWNRCWISLSISVCCAQLHKISRAHRFCWCWLLHWMWWSGLWWS